MLTRRHYDGVVSMVVVVNDGSASGLRYFTLRALIPATQNF
jgi:hypothetical protein